MARKAGDSIFSRYMELLFLVYFIVHVPITIFIDSQLVLGSKFHPAWAVQVTADYIRDVHDFLVKVNPVWFYSMVLCEMFLQLPCFFVSMYGIVKQASWMPLVGVIYGTHVSTTLVPILASFILEPLDPENNTGPMYESDRLPLVAVYVAWIIVPLLMVLHYAPMLRRAPLKSKTA
ncbi:unnamed protein product [Pedinophyceae sp. YPF-701]|nr:unnamed protein product [Pedinophyceae sp. YPF-701]